MKRVFHDNKVIFCGLIIQIFIVYAIFFLYDKADIVKAVITVPGISWLVGVLSKKLFTKKKVDINAASNSFNEIRLSYRDSKTFDNTIKDKKGLYIITGESGAGKTWWLNKLFENEPDCVRFDLYYENSDWKERTINKKYLLFDQFERALALPDLSGIISLIRENSSKKLIIISVRKEYFGEVIHAFGAANCRIAGHDWLEFSSNEKEELTRELERRKEGRFSGLFALMHDCIERNTLTFIQISYINKLIQDTAFVNSIKVLPKFEDKDDIDRIIEQYFEALIDRCPNSDVACVILYLLCLDSSGSYINTPVDFQNISFAPKDKVNATIGFIEEKGLIVNVKTSGLSGDSDLRQFEVSHDYLISTLTRICREKVSAGNRHNIEYYHDNIQQKRCDDGTVGSSKTSNALNKIYESFVIGIEKPTFDKVLSCVMLVVFAILNVLLALSFYGESIIPSVTDFIVQNSGFSQENAFDACLTLASTDIVVGISLLYVYNYYSRILRAVGKKLGRGWRIGFGCIAVIGALACLGAYVFMSLWAVCLGLEIVAFAILTLFLKGIVRHGERRFFTKLTWSTLISGVITIALGCFFPTYTNSGDFLSVLPFFSLYGAFMCFCIHNHILNNNDLMIRGKVLFNAEETDASN